MNLRRLRNSFALTLLLALIVPILAACGGTAATPPAATSAPAPAATAAPAATTATEPTAGTAATAEPTAAVTEPTAAASDDSPKSPAGNIIRINAGEPDNIDPQQASFVNEIQFIMLNFLPIMTFGQDLKPKPGSAESYTVSADGLTYTFKMRPNMKYSDGEPLTAKNFEFALKRLADPTVAGEYRDIARAIKGYTAYTDAFSPAEGTTALSVTDVAELQALRDAVGVKALDDNTLEIVLEEPAPYFLNVLALWVAAPSREDKIEEGGDTWWSDPQYYIGNGPFQLQEWEHQSRASWVRNENYALTENMPTIDGIEFSMITEGQAAFEAYKNDELDFGGVGAEDLATVLADAELSKQVTDLTGTCSFYLGYNNAKAPFDKKEVRQAFSYAFDRDAWVRDIQQGLGKKTLTFIPPGFPGYQENETRFDFNPTKAKELLASAGYADPSVLEIKLTYPSSTRNKARFEWIAGQLQANLGVKIVLDPVDATVYTALTKDPETTPQMFYLGWCADYPDPQNFLSLVFHTGGISAGRIGYSNPEFDKLVEAADKELDEAKRFDLYKQAQDILIDDQPVSFVSNDAAKQLQKPWVTASGATPLDYFPYIFSLNTLKVNY